MVTHLLAEPAPKLLRHAFSDGHGRYPAGLRAAYLALQTVALFVEVLSHLRRLTATCLTCNVTS